MAKKREHIEELMQNESSIDEAWVSNNGYFIIKMKPNAEQLLEKRQNQWDLIVEAMEICGKFITSGRIEFRDNDMRLLGYVHPKYRSFFPGRTYDELKEEVEEALEVAEAVKDICNE